MKIAHIDLGKHPILLAPMEDVTDPAFRLMCKKFGAMRSRPTVWCQIFFAPEY